MILILLMFLSLTCSDKNDDNEKTTPHKKAVDSLTLIKENETIQANKLRHDLDSLKKHLDSLKAITSDSL